MQQTMAHAASSAQRYFENALPAAAIAAACLCSCAEREGSTTKLRTASTRVPTAMGKPRQQAPPRPTTSAQAHRELAPRAVATSPCHGEPVDASAAQRLLARPASSTPDRVDSELRELHRLYPCSTRLVTLGHSHEQRPILAMQLGSKQPQAIPVLLDAAHHGDEAETVAFVMDAARQLLRAKKRNPQLAAWLNQLKIWLVPVVNPDGLAHAWRKNGRDNNGNGRVEPGDGVDLNRNYPFRFGALGTEASSHQTTLGVYRGPHGGSEPETQAIMRLAELEHFAAGISYHYGAVAWLVPYTTRGVPQQAQPMALRIAKQIVPRLPHHPHAQPQMLFPVRRRLYPVDGTSQDWLHARFGTLAYIVEGGLRGAPTSPMRQQGIQSVVRATWQKLFERIVKGPTLQIQSLATTGAPVSVELHLEGNQPRAGEIWRSRCSDGRAVRFVEQGGNQLLRIRGRDGELLQRPVTIQNSGVTRLQLVVPPTIRPFACTSTTPMASSPKPAESSPPPPTPHHATSHE